jgi:hypothetical protein
MESICDLGDHFGADCSLFPYTRSNVVTEWKCREQLYLERYLGDEK